LAAPSSNEAPRAAAQPAAGRWPGLAPFGTPSFRHQWPADLGTAWALEMETLILGWYVLVESGSVAMLTVFGALLYVGTLLSPLMGTLGDRIGLGRVLAAMRLAYAAAAGVILWLAATGELRPALVLAVAFVVGLIKPTDIGMRTALVSASVPAEQLVAAMGISRTTQDSARIGGALAGAGFMASLGMVSAYAVIVGLYLLGAALTVKAGGAQRRQDAAAAWPAPASSAWRDLKEGLRHVWFTPRLRAAMLLAALVNLCAFPLTGGLMPYVAREVFGLDQQGLGWLVASYASGALIGSLGVSALGGRLQAGRSMLLACALWYLCLLGLAAPVGLPLALALLMAAGLFQSVSMVSLSIILLRTSEERFRGRVMGARMLAIYTLPIGLLAAGALIPLIGFHRLVALYVGSGLVALATMAWHWRRELVAGQAAANARG
jgi:MFS family permease